MFFGLIIKIKVFPSSKKEEIKKISENFYNVYLKKPPLDNRANKELIKFLKNYFKTNIKILKGMKSNYKIIELVSKI